MKLPRKDDYSDLNDYLKACQSYNKYQEKIMKANEAPEKLYFGRHEGSLLDTYSKKEAEDEIEYVRTDALIEKVCEWLDLHMPFGEVDKKLRDEVIDDLKRYVKENKL